MKLSLSANICALRKAHGMTQEQLADALGVSFASVSKWERGVATPELGLIAQIANLFGVSLDALVGFEVLSSGAATLEERIHSLMRQKDYDSAIAEAEKALLRYPNDFKIVYRAGELYAMAGIELNCKPYLHRCIGLLERSILLLSQNTDPKISEVSIQNELAQCAIALGETEKGIQLLKQYNISGVHDSLIAISLTGNDITFTDMPEFGLEDAVPYMMSAFASLINNSLRTMLAYANYFRKKQDYAASREALTWLIDFLKSVKLCKDLPSYMDKVLAPCYSECACLSHLLGQEEQVEPYLRAACQSAFLFDNARTTGVENLKFCIGDVTNAATYDDIGESAVDAVTKQLSQKNRDPHLLEIWKQLCNETRQEAHYESR